MTAQRKKIGDIEVTTLSDGVLAAPLDVVLDMDKAETERLAGSKPGEPLPIAVNAFLLRREGKWALIDTGAGNTMGPTLGKLPDNLRAMGVAPEQIETIFLTHLHPDHSNGLVDDAGNAIYPNAEVVVHATEANSGSIATRRPARASASVATSPRPRSPPRLIATACAACATAR